MTTHRATVRTRVPSPDAVAAAVRPDDTAQMRTAVEGDSVVTAIERGTTGGLRSTVDDYVVNVSVAVEVRSLVDHGGPPPDRPGGPSPDVGGDVNDGPPHPPRGGTDDGPAAAGGSRTTEDTNQP